MLALAGRHRQAIAALEEGWKWLPEGDGYAQSTPAAVWLGESYQAIGDEASSRFWCEKAVHHALEFTAFNPSIAYYWQGKALQALGDMPGALQAYRTALSLHRLYPARWETEENLKILQNRV